MYQAYANEEYYKSTYGGISIPDEQLARQLKLASRHVDTLTYNRIVGNYDNLTEFQKEIVSEVCCRLAEFEYENSDMLSSILQSYSLNGASVSFGPNWNIYIQGGVAIPRDVYLFLSQTGLCTANLGGRL